MTSRSRGYGSSVSWCLICELFTPSLFSQGLRLRPLGLRFVTLDDQPISTFSRLAFELKSLSLWPVCCPIHSRFMDVQPVKRADGCARGVESVTLSHEDIFFPSCVLRTEFQSEPNGVLHIMISS